MSNQADFETIIVGAGPAGLQLGYFLEKAGRSYVILETNTEAGSFFKTHPRHRKLLSINKVNVGREQTDFKLRHDWNCLLTNPGDEMPYSGYSDEYFPDADTLVRYLGDFARRFELNIHFERCVETVERGSDGDFRVACQDGSNYRGKRLVIASGLFKPWMPDIPGIDLAEGYEDMSVDPKDFTGQTVLILGKGNSALETANNLLAHATYIHLSSPEPMKLAYDTHFVGHARSVNGVFHDSYLLKSQNGILDGPTHSITKLPSGKFQVRWSAIHTEVESEIEQFEYDRVIRCTGFQMDTDIFGDGCKPELRSCGRLPAMTGRWESTNVPGLFFAGTMMQGIDYKKSQSSFIHGFRYNVRTLFHILEERDHGQELPHADVACTPKAIADKLLWRANNCSSLWQQIGFLCDVAVLPKNGQGEVRWYYDLNQQLVRESSWAQDPDCEYYVSMMTYGPGVGNPNFEGTAFNHPHMHPYDHDKQCGDLVTEIHPVLKHFKGAEMQIEYHMRTDFLTDWDSDFYRNPLLEFLEWDLLGGERPTWARPQTRELIRNADMRFSDVLINGQSLSSKRSRVATAN